MISGETATLDFSISVGAATETEAPPPSRPVMRLRYSGQLYDGVQGSHCWPVSQAGGVGVLCADTGPSPDFGAPISVDAGDSVAVEIEAYAPPQKLIATYYEIDSETYAPSAELDAGLEAALPADLPAGTYNVRIMGQWADGDWDMAYHFKIELGQ